MAVLFPDPYFHIGGDEVEESQWKRSVSIQAFAREHQLTGSHELQAYFNRRVEKLVKKHGKIMIGWDEVLGPHLAQDTVIQSWRGQASLAEAAAKGHPSVLSFGYYLDHLDPAGVHYANDPMDGKAGNLTPAQAARVLGGEACMWSEYVSPETVDSRIWPRLAAIAERFWSSREVTGVESMYTRLEAVSRSLEWTSVEHRSNYEVMLDRLAGGRSSEPLRLLADASEALGIAGRRDARHYTSVVPLNRLVDAVRPESELVQRLERDVTNLKANPAAAAELRTTLTAWAENEPRIKQLAENNQLLAELVPLAHSLAAIGNTGLRALDYIEKREAAPANWLAEESGELDRLEQPVAEVRLAGVRVVRLLLAQLRLQSLDNSSVRCGNEPPCNGGATVWNWTLERRGTIIALNRL
jgi:hexosaminidase